MRASLLVLVGAFVVLACVGDNPDVDTPGGTGPSNRVIQCNDKKCAAGEVCCLKIGASFVEEALCTAEGSCSTATKLVCDSTADCPSGEICCVKTNGGSVAYGPSFCSPSACASPNRQLCATSAECPTGKACEPPQSSTTPTGLMQCAE